MKKSIIFSAVFALFATISFAQQTTATQIVGADKDAHGCMASAGYTFSVVKNDCVRLSEQTLKLNEVNPKGTSTSFAAVIFSKNNKKAEVFLPTGKSQVLLRSGKKGNFVWKKGTLSLRNTNGYVLKRASKVIFSEK